MGTVLEKPSRLRVPYLLFSLFRVLVFYCVLFNALELAGGRFCGVRSVGADRRSNKGSAAQGGGKPVIFESSSVSVVFMLALAVSSLLYAWETSPLFSIFRKTFPVSHAVRLFFCVTAVTSFHIFSGKVILFLCMSLAGALMVFLLEILLNYLKTR